LTRARARITLWLRHRRWLKRAAPAALPVNLCQELAMQHIHPPPDQAMSNHPLEYSDPELRAYAEEQAEDIFEAVVRYMPLVLPIMAALLIFMLAFVAVTMA
jgi:hypothetical protein